MQPLFEYRLELAGFQTRALELEGEGPALLLLHGFADSADTWRLVLDRLGRIDQRALAVDLPGFATAARLRDGSVLDQLDAFAAAAVRHLRKDTGREVLIVGNSLGGAIALRAAQNGRLPLAGIVPVAPAGLEMPAWFGVIQRDPIVRTVLRSPVPLPEPVVRAAVGAAFRQLAFARPLAASAQVVRSFAAHHGHQRDLARALDAGRRMLPELRDPFDLERIRCPVLLVWGDHDRMVSHRGAARITAALPGTTYELLEGCGHCPQLEAPDRLVEALLRFIASAPARKPARAARARG